MLLRYKTKTPAEVLEYLRSCCDIDPVTDCWLWRGKTTKAGYVETCVNGKPCRAHRAAYAAKHGYLSKDVQLDHKCHDPKLCYGGSTCPHRRCLNPDHVEPSTPKENGSPERSNRTRPGRWNKFKSHCKYGHEFNEENTYTCPQGYRHCRVCQRIRDQKLYAEGLYQQRKAKGHYVNANANRNARRKEAKLLRETIAGKEA